jgi:hypothetical protein
MLKLDGGVTSMDAVAILPSAAMLYTYDFHCQFTRSLSFASFQRRNIDPSSRPVALQSRAENRELS